MPSGSRVSCELRMGRVALTGFIASLFLSHAAVIHVVRRAECTRTLVRSSISSAISVLFSRFAAQSSGPPSLVRCTRTPSTAYSSYVLVLETTKHAEVRPEERCRQLYSPATGLWASRERRRLSRTAVPRPAVLRCVLGNGVDLRRRTDVGIAHGERADLARRAHVLLHQRRGHTEDVRDVVESVGRVVRRQQRGGIDFEVEQFPDGVGVPVRFNRWSAGRPGFGFARAASSSAPDSVVTSARRVAASG